MSSMCQVHPMAAMVSPSVLTYRTVNVLGDVPPGRKNPLWYGASKRLKKLRGVTQLTQAELGKLAGCSASTVGTIEKSEFRTTIELIEALAVALGVSAVYLAYGHDGHLVFQQKRAVPDVLPTDPEPQPTAEGFRDRWQGMPERLRLAREARGYTMRGLARLAGLTAQAVLYTEEGKTVPKVDTCELLAVALHVAPGWLAYGEGEGIGVALELAKG